MGYIENKKQREEKNAADGPGPDADNSTSDDATPDVDVSADVVDDTELAPEQETEEVDNGGGGDQGLVQGDDEDSIPPPDKLDIVECRVRVKQLENENAVLKNQLRRVNKLNRKMRQEVRKLRQRPRN